MAAAASSFSSSFNYERNSVKRRKEGRKEGNSEEASSGKIEKLACLLINPPMKIFGACSPFFFSQPVPCTFLPSSATHFYFIPIRDPPSPGGF